MALSEYTGVEPTDAEVNQILLVGLILAVLAPVLLWVGLPKLVHTLSHTWTPVEGRVEATESLESGSPKAKIYYQYTVDGQHYSGAFVTKIRNTTGSGRAVRFAPGSSLELFYASESPDLSRLEPEPATNEWMTPIIGGLCALMAPLLLWKRRMFAAWLVDIEERILGS